MLIIFIVGLNLEILAPVLYWRFEIKLYYLSVYLRLKECYYSGLLPGGGGGVGCIGMSKYHLYLGHNDPYKHCDRAR